MAKRAHILLLIPVDKRIPQNILMRTKRMAHAMKESCKATIDIVFDDRGPGNGIKQKTRDSLAPFVGKMADIRQEIVDEHLRPEHTHVMWIDADIIDYPPTIADDLVARNYDGISAPMVLMEGTVGRFFDIAGFVEKGGWCNIFPPHFKQAGPKYELDSVGAFYTVNADIYRNGAKHTYSKEYTEHYSVCQDAIEMGRKVMAYEDLAVWHFNTSTKRISGFNHIRSKIEYVHDKNVSVEIIIPTVDRKESLQKLRDSIDKFCPGTKVTVFKDAQAKGVNLALNTLYRTSESDIVIFLADDTEVTSNIVKICKKEMHKRFPDMDGMLGLNQTNLPEKENCHEFSFPVLGRAFIDRFPNRNVFCPFYGHYYGDTELGLYAKSIGKFHFCKEAEIIHYHPFFSDRKQDQTWMIAHRRMQGDMALFKDRQSRGKLWGKDFEK